MLLFIIIDYPQFGKEYVPLKNSEDSIYNGKFHKQKKCIKIIIVCIKYTTSFISIC